MRAGQLLGDRYRLVERIGTGGMGEVWRAEDTRLTRTVAIKILHTGLAEDADYRRRFLQEARAVAAMNQPGVVDLYDTREEPGPDGSLLSYLVMEFVSGRPLSKLIAAQGGLPVGDVLGLVEQVARGLAAAHQAGIVHRDIKPGNILVGDNGDATIVDFGIARRRGEAALTATGSVMGTVEYASPEQLHGDTLTGASDVYSLGVVAYQCLTGSRPFEGDSPATVIAGHLHRPPPRLPEHVPAEVVRLVMRMLAKDPGRRYASAGQLAQDCRALATRRHTAEPAPPDPRPIVRGVAAPSTRRLPTEPWTPPDEPGSRGHGGEPEIAPIRRRRRWVPVLAVVLLLLVGGVVFWWWPNTGGDAQAGEDTATESASPSEVEVDSGPTEPKASVMVSADSGLCLLLSKPDGSAEAVSASMGLCEGSRHETYEFLPQDGGIAVLRFTSPHGDQDRVNCLAATTSTTTTPVIVADPGCDPAIGWRFVYLRTDDAVDYWQVRSAADEGYCLRAGAEVTVTPCHDGADQQWRTDSG